MKPPRSLRMYRKTRQRVVKIWARQYISTCETNHNIAVNVKDARIISSKILAIAEKSMAKSPYIMRGMLKSIKGKT